MAFGPQSPALNLLSKYHPPGAYTPLVLNTPLGLNILFSPNLLPILSMPLTSQVAEKERVMDLLMPASQLTPCASDKHLLAACRDGSLVLYGLNDLSLHGRWSLHDSPATTTAGPLEGGHKGANPLGCTAALLLEGNLMMTVGADRLLNVIEMVPGSVAAAAAAAARRAGRPSRVPGTPSAPASLSRMQSSASPGMIDTPAVGAGGFKAWAHLGVSELLSSGPLIQEVELQAAKAMTWTEAR